MTGKRKPQPRSDMVPEHAAAFSYMMGREFFQYNQMMPRVAFSFGPLMMRLFCQFTAKMAFLAILEER